MKRTEEHIREKIRNTLSGMDIPSSAVEEIMRSVDDLCARASAGSDLHKLLMEELCKNSLVPNTPEAAVATRLLNAAAAYVEDVTGERSRAHEPAPPPA